MEFITIEKGAVEDLGIEFEKDLIVKSILQKSPLWHLYGRVIGKKLVTINRREMRTLTDVIAATLGAVCVEIGFQKNELNHQKYTVPLGNKIPTLTRPSDYMCDLGSTVDALQRQQATKEEEEKFVPPPPPPPSPSASATTLNSIQTTEVRSSSGSEKARILSELDKKIRDAPSTDEFLSHVSQRIRIARQLQQSPSVSHQTNDNSSKVTDNRKEGPLPVGRRHIRSPNISDSASASQKLEPTAPTERPSQNPQPLRVVTNTVGTTSGKKTHSNTRMAREDPICVDRVAQTSKGLWASLPKTVAERNQSLGLWKPKPQRSTWKNS
eukprot:TRINITY_DN3667_c1_g1_i1.p1 TRINITY_DN3667_c1_g1~~TRINITY_DN3667_c1_g1_i1.p1  ORF type:complete len:325 (+),score=57.85 TRINITY_DN3667_c1_g1_i1:58-1032(+)